MNALDEEDRRKKDRRGGLDDRRSDIDRREVKNSRYSYLLNTEILSIDQLTQAFVLSKKMNKSVGQTLIDDFKINKEAVLQSFSMFYGCPCRSYDDETPTPVELIGNLRKAFLLQDLWIPISWSKDGIEILVDDPTDLSKIDHIKALIKTEKILFSVGIKEDIVEFIKNFFDEKAQKKSTIDAMLYDFDVLSDVSFEEEEAEEEIEEFSEASGQVVKLIDQLIVSAWRANASDIHIEPSPIMRSTLIRFRMDGVCTEYMKVPISMAKGILSRLKIMAGLDISEKRLPQDGKIRFKRKGIPPFELRLATYPVAGGHEDSVLRILAKAGVMNLDDMELNERNLKIMKKIITQPYGLILAVGPTGSGKTTSLHAALGYINKPDIKILTAEDPVEITQLGLRQVEVKPRIGFDFARTMRAFLRADPDVIMIGEMRDYETASIALEASLTGHLVFSTLHTNSAPETVTRLLDMDLNPLNFSDACLGVLAQRLVRRLCINCREAYNPSEGEFKEIVTDYGEEHFQATGIQFTPDLTLYRPEGCKTCSWTGYKGRIGVYELMEATGEIKRMIKKQADTEDLFLQAMKDDMTNLKQDGIMKVLQGLTAINEIRRVCI